MKKRKWIFEPDEFFIGYRPEVPGKTATFLRRCLIVIGAIILVISFVIVISQQNFSRSQFDYGINTTLEGELYTYPVPHLKLYKGSDATKNKIYQSLLLVGAGKTGSSKMIANFESQLGSLEGKFVKISGQLIHGNGKALLQLSEDTLPEILMRQVDSKETVPFNVPGVPATIKGEIVDPKCFFGVMKPGEGKPHRSCAIRCISGGIPPVLHAIGKSDYFLLLDEHFQPINQQVLSIVGDDIELKGNVVEWDDWKILLVETERLKVLTSANAVLQNLASMEAGMTKCGLRDDHESY